MYVCEKCQEKFDDAMDYNQHKLDHQNGLLDDYEIDDAGIVGPAKPKVVEAEALGKLPPAGTATGKQLKRPEPKPPMLLYTYTGEHNCGTQLETITLDNVLSDKDKVIVVAWCPDCRVKVTQRTVVKL